MRCFQNYHYRSLLGLAILFVIWALPVRAQDTSKPVDEEADVKSLLVEVRLLRQTLQAAALNSYRSQIIIERIRANNEHVLRMTRALNELRDDMEKTRVTIPRMTEQVKVMETALEAEIDVAKRAQLEFEIKDRKRSVENYKVRLERLKEQEQQQSMQLREQQNKLTELENRLDLMESEIENDFRRQKADDRVGDGRNNPKP